MRSSETRKRCARCGVIIALICITSSDAKTSRIRHVSRQPPAKRGFGNGSDVTTQARASQHGE